jgi:hypothetical protein
VTTPIGPDPANPYGIGGGASILNQYGVSVQGGSIAPPLLAASIPGNTSSGQVFMGSTKKKTTRLIQEIGPDGRRISVPATGTETSDDYISLEEARNLPAIWAREDPGKLRDFVNKGIIAKIPGFDSDMGLPEIMSKWDDFVSVSMELGKTGQKWSPWDVMDTYGNTKGKFGTERRGDFVYDVATGQAVKYVGPKTKTTKQTQVNLSSAEDVKAIAIQALREALGRAPTTEEVAKFKSTINALEKATPEVTTTTSELKPNLATGEVETVSQSATTSGGVSQAAIQETIMGQVEGTDEAGKYQAGTTYFNALLGLLGG